VAPWTTDPCSTDGKWTRRYLVPCATTTTSPPTPSLPVTGQSDQTLLWALVVSMLGVGFVAIARRKVQP
jgi:LPXTG-motif cell wall-anchored protein